ncbi:MAG: DUF4339 domain-containing protein [Planctomycetes bacterium]|nr:DUF4339 domain-containing protein [Planctomycetota bacterium]
MASRWFCKVLGQEMGPLSFQGLAEMVRAGTVTESDPVRRKESSKWTPAGEVIGLFRAAKSEPAETAPPDSEVRPEPAAVPREPTKADQGSRATSIPRPGRRAWLCLGGAGVVVLLAVLTVWAGRARQSRRFPEPRLGKPAPAAKTRLASILPPRPKVPSIPGLKRKVPKPVTGLEEMDPVYSFSLSADMCTIVCCWEGNLHIATRDDVSRPFGEPRVIESCASQGSGERPTLSPDGLEMIYARWFDDNAHFFYTRRHTSSSEFGESVPWDVPKSVKVGGEFRLARFLDPLRVTVTIGEVGGKGHWIFLSERASPNSSFGAARDLPSWKVGLTACYSEDGSRAYLGWGKGLYIAARDSENESFGPPVMLADAALTGPITGGVWVAPQEDVIFYCSPGPGKELGSSRKLWMIRF